MFITKGIHIKGELGFDMTLFSLITSGVGYSIFTRHCICFGNIRFFQLTKHFEISFINSLWAFYFYYTFFNCSWTHHGQFVTVSFLHNVFDHVKTVGKVRDWRHLKQLRHHYNSNFRKAFKTKYFDFIHKMSSPM